MATKAHLEGTKRYQDKLYRVPVYIDKDAKEILQTIAKDKGYSSLNGYIKALLEKDTGLNL